MYLLGKDDQWKSTFKDKIKERRKVQIIKTSKIEPYLKDYAFFTFAPLYVYAGVSYSMPDQFELENGKQDRILVDYQRTVIKGLGKWGGLVEGIAADQWEPFCRYLASVMFASFEKKLVWLIRTHWLDVESTDAMIVTPNALPVRLCVFVPDGNEGRMQVKGGLPAKLWWDDPRPEIVSAANTVLSCKGRIEDAS